jgi:ferredoxin
MAEPSDPLTILVDRDRCMGSGMCIMYAPNTFDYDEDTKAIVVDSQGDGIDSVRIAIEACPTSALRILENQEGMR